MGKVFGGVKRVHGVLEDYMWGGYLRITVDSWRCVAGKTKQLIDEPVPGMRASPHRAHSVPERVVEDVLSKDLGIIEDGLELVRRQYMVSGGRIDILARDREGRLVVIEVKSGLADDSTLTQLLSYMSSIEGEEGKPVRGIIVAEDFTRRLLLASKKIDSVKLVKIRPHITIDKIGEY